jgi:regulator of nucleoside diphosphate kinase
MSDIDESAFPARPPIVLTASDRNRLYALLNVTPEVAFDVACFLREELDRADVVDDALVTTPLVRMGSEVEFIALASVRVEKAILVYPNQADGSRAVSVLSTVGSALIGLGPGQSISWNEHGATRHLTVLGVRSPSE